MNDLRTPTTAWHDLCHGNERFVSGNPLHPRQDVERRTELANKQNPLAAIFGCSDSRLSAEIIFDKGLGDLFVVRNAGQVISNSVLGSLEYAITVLHIPLIVVLGHDGCGAVQAAIDSRRADAPPLPPHIDELVKKITPAVRRVQDTSDSGTPTDAVDVNEVGKEHLRDTVNGLVQNSEIMSTAIADGTLAIIGANYCLIEGRANPDLILGRI